MGIVVNIFLKRKAIQTYNNNNNKIKKKLDPCEEFKMTK